MIVCGVVIFIGMALCLYFRKAGRQSQKNICLILMLSAFFGLLAEGTEEENDIWMAEDELRRNENGEGDYAVELELEIPEVLKEESYEITVLEQQLSAAEKEAYLDAAKEEIEQTFLGDNKSYENVWTMVDIRDTYQEEKVTAEWSFDNYRVINETGEVSTEDLEEDGELVGATVLLACGNLEEEYAFYFRVVPKELTETEQILKKLNEELTKQSEKESLKIPQKLGEYTLIWKQKKSYTAIKILLLGVLVAVCYPQIEASRQQEVRKKREKELLMQYPDMVSKLTLLLGAGMTLYGAWKRIATGYEKKRKNNTFFKQYVYEEMLLTCREIESGMGEARAYERFGERCGLRQYRKFSSLLAQNLKKGTRGLSALLEEEVENAFEERKSQARKYGEEAGTKLLFPMMLMFGIVMVIIIVPAVISFQM